VSSTYLSLIRSFSQRTGLPAPNFVTASTDTQIIQIGALLQEVLEDLFTYNWTALVRESTFLSLPQEEQGSISSLAPAGFRAILADTIFDRTRRLPIYGPLSPRVWQAQKALQVSGAFLRYRITDGMLRFFPSPPADHSCVFEYYSTFSVLSPTGAPQAVFLSDLDTCLFPDPLLLAGLRWKWKSEKGLDYAEDFRRYEELRMSALASDGTKPVLSMDDEAQIPYGPGIYISPGSWPL
jgi:hypothetical protein